MLLTGLHSGHAYIRGNDEWAERGDVWNYAAAVADASLEGQRPIPDTTFTLAKMLQESGLDNLSRKGAWVLRVPVGPQTSRGLTIFMDIIAKDKRTIYIPNIYGKMNKK